MYLSCNCPVAVVSSEEECLAIEHNGYNFLWVSESCAKSAGGGSKASWNYDDAEAECASNDLYARNREKVEGCCTDSISVCMDYTSQLCLNPEAFNASALTESTCNSYVYGTTASAEFIAAFSCPEGCASGCPDADGCDYDISDYACYCGHTIDSQEECLAIDHNGYNFQWVQITCAQAAQENRWLVQKFKLTDNDGALPFLMVVYLFPYVQFCLWFVLDL